ncbi:hypothetical protein [Fulvitalea axinellae]
MEREQVDYILVYFSYLMTSDEALALRHCTSSEKLATMTEGDREKMTPIYLSKGWLTDEKDALDLLKDGIDRFYQNVAERIMAEHADKVFMNKCPKCGRLARTPKARQCGHCGNEWR